MTESTKKQRSGSGLSTRLTHTTVPLTQPVDTDRLSLDELRKLADAQLRKENSNA